MTSPPPGGRPGRNRVRTEGRIRAGTPQNGKPCPPPRKRPWGGASPAAAAVLVMLLATAPATAPADPVQRLREALPAQAGRCESNPGGIGSKGPEGAQCLLGNGLNLLLDEAMGLANGYGQEAFGQRFRMVGTPAFSAVPGGVRLAGDIDVLIPFAGGGPGGTGTPAGSALFLQQGVSRWRDGHGSPRDDFRLGLVYRFRLPGGPDADILGLSLLQLHNAERQHEVLVPGIDYSGRWGSGSLRHFLPVTGWRPVRPGHEERALAGTEFEARLDLTTTLRVNATGYRWESGDGAGQWNDGVRLGFGWRPHPWLHLAAAYDRGGEGEGRGSFHVGFRRPLGKIPRPPGWAGLGLAAGGSVPGDSELWRPVEGAGRIRVGARTAVSGLVGDAEIRFLEDTVGSGDTVQLEVVLASAAPQDIRVEVRLVPGSGDNPAVPGEDFVDMPVELTIPRGATSGRVSIRLLRNDNQQENRSLGATATLAS